MDESISAGWEGGVLVRKKRRYLKMLVFSGKELYKRKEVLNLLKAFKERKISRIEPKISLEGALSYVDAEKIMDARGEVVRNILEELAEDGFLIRELLETRIACPQCGSLNVSLRLRCSACGSTSIKRGESIQHNKCGYIDFKTVFTVTDGLMICPKCNESIKKERGDYVEKGVLYKCLVCGEFSQNPIKEFICSRCEKNYREEDYNPFEVYGYSVNEERKEIIEIETLDLGSVVKNLRSAFWEVKTSVFLSGKSGLEHPFTMVAYRPGTDRASEETRIIVDIFFEDKSINEIPVISFFSKILDVEVKHAILLAVPSANDKAKELAKSYGISVFECGKMDEVADTLWNAIRPIVEEEASKTFMEIAGILETSQVIKNLIKEETEGSGQQLDSKPVEI
ncbi:MAG: hypothetical protein QXS51_03620 [Thermoproteota archaeon]|nr:hypothetical protein [Candidatus Brockarchaeota archaeon]